MSLLLIKNYLRPVKDKSELLKNIHIKQKHFTQLQISLKCTMFFDFMTYARKSSSRIRIANFKNFGDLVESLCKSV